MEEKTTVKRRIFLINKSFQFRFLFIAVPIMLLTAIAIGVTIPLLYQSGFKWRFVFAFIVYSITLSLFSILYTHSIAGPLYKLGKVLREITYDKIPKNKFKFRDSDQFQWLASDFERYIETRRKEILLKEKIISNLDSLKEMVKKNQHSPDDCAAAVDEITNLLTVKKQPPSLF